MMRRRVGKPSTYSCWFIVIIDQLMGSILKMMDDVAPPWMRQHDTILIILLL